MPQKKLTFMEEYEKLKESVKNKRTWIDTNEARKIVLEKRGKSISLVRLIEWLRYKNLGVKGMAKRKDRWLVDKDRLLMYLNGEIK